MTSPDFNLKELVTAVRDELETLDQQRRSANVSPLFELREMELELQFTVAADTSGNGKFDLKVVSFGAKETIRKEQIQRLTLKFAVPESALKTNLLGTRAHSSDPQAKVQDISPL